MKSGMIEKNKVIASIQVRTGSTRLPGKVLKKICGKPMLLLMLERLSKCKLLDEIIISTTVNKNDDPIVEFHPSLGKYLNKISGPLLDRIDIHIEVTPVPFDKLSGETKEESSGEVRKRVIMARQTQEKRFANSNGSV